VCIAASAQARYTRAQRLVLGDRHHAMVAADQD
jgi:hypothetical protein